MDILVADIIEKIIEYLNYESYFLITSKKINVKFNYISKKTKNLIYIKHSFECMKTCSWLKSLYPIFRITYYNDNVYRKIKNHDDFDYYYGYQIGNGYNYYINSTMNFLHTKSCYTIITLSYFQTLSKNDLYKKNVNWCIKRISQIICKMPNINNKSRYGCEMNFGVNELTHSEKFKFDISAKQKYNFTPRNKNLSLYNARLLANFLIDVVNTFYLNMGLKTRIKINHVKEHTYCLNCDLWSVHKCDLCNFEDLNINDKINDENYINLEESLRRTSAIISVYIDEYF